MRFEAIKVSPSNTFVDLFIAFFVGLIGKISICKPNGPFDLAHLLALFEVVYRGVIDPNNNSYNPQPIFFHLPPKY